MSKIIIDAGHGKNTAGKRCLKSLDPNETREWVLDARVADALEMYLLSAVLWILYQRIGWYYLAVCCLQWTDRICFKAVFNKMK